MLPIKKNKSNLREPFQTNGSSLNWQIAFCLFLKTVCSCWISENSGIELIFYLQLFYFFIVVIVILILFVNTTIIFYYYFYYYTKYSNCYKYPLILLFLYLYLFDHIIILYCQTNNCILVSLFCIFVWININNFISWFLYFK